MQESLLAQGLELMLFGMGTVVLFLTLLVVVTILMSALLARLPSPEPVATPARASAAGVEPDPTLLAVISGAIHQHRKGR